MTDNQQRAAEVVDAWYNCYLGTLDELTIRVSAALDAAEARGRAEAKANLGLATTRELLDEIAARIDVDHASGGGGLDYRTVDGGRAAVLRKKES